VLSHQGFLDLPRTGIIDCLLPVRTFSALLAAMGAGALGACRVIDRVVSRGRMACLVSFVVWNRVLFSLRLLDVIRCYP
jgi:hypothetical protein